MGKIEQSPLTTYRLKSFADHWLVKLSWACDCSVCDQLCPRVNDSGCSSDRRLGLRPEDLAAVRRSRRNAPAINPVKSRLSSAKRSVNFLAKFYLEQLLIISLSRYLLFLGLSIVQGVMTMQRTKVIARMNNIGAMVNFVLVFIFIIVSL